MLAAQNIQTGERELMVAGGMESMSNAPCVPLLWSLWMLD
jgi:acetyl-CoA acetyltransferase